MIRNLRAIVSILLWLVKGVVMRLIAFWGNYEESLRLSWDSPSLLEKQQVIVIWPVRNLYHEAIIIIMSYGMKVCIPPKLIYWNPNPKVMALGGGAFGGD